MMLEAGEDRFTATDLYELSRLVVAAWTSAYDRDWSVPAGTVEWSCMKTADHAVDCVYAPASFLASRKRDSYPDIGFEFTIGAAANPARLVQSLEIATRILVAVVNDAGPEAEAVIFRRPEFLTARPPDFLPRGAMELILHCHDVCSGLRIPFGPPADLCYRLREHTRRWPMWTISWGLGLGRSDDPWGDLLAASGRHRQGDLVASS